MPAELSANLPLILIGLALLVLAVWLLARAGRKAKVIADDSTAPLVRDVLAEGSAPAPRNQALIDAAPAAVKQAPAPETAAAPVVAPPAAPPAATVAAPVREASSPTPAPADDLTRIKGVGPKLVALLGELGISNFAQIAAWTDADVARIDAQLGRFEGRITRDQWIEQAKLLASGDEASFAGKFGNNG